MASQQRVSLVVRTFNDDPAHLRQAVSSARAQTHRDTEVLVVDDGSPRAETIAAIEDLQGVEDQEGERWRRIGTKCWHCCGLRRVHRLPRC
ncbi:glycosyltransferase [Ornithinimicrobium cryptoxanthini]|uniref:glycosyltransferase n=1 Tax=Ornithinimicrobium cryptoxanthini TaxID=2934161 RepID=UPI00351C8A31